MNTAINLEELKTAWRGQGSRGRSQCRTPARRGRHRGLMPSKLDGGVTDTGVTVTTKSPAKVDAVALQNDWHPARIRAYRRSRGNPQRGRPPPARAGGLRA